MNEREETSRREPGPGLRVGVWIILTTFAMIFGATAATCIGRLTEEPPAEPTTVTVVRPTADVVVAMRDLARLETAQFHMERIVDLEDRQSRFFGLIEAEDAMLLVAAGDVTAGVDLTQLADGDVVVDPERRTARIVLPPPAVLSTDLDNDRTYVHSRDTDLLAERSQTLETRARQEAERTLEASAIEAGLLVRARSNAERAVTTLVRALGYEFVEVAWSDDER